MRAFSWHRLAINLQLCAFLFTGNNLYLSTPFSNSVTLVTSFYKLKTILKARRKNFNFGATLFQVVQHKSSVYQNDEFSWDCRKIERKFPSAIFWKLAQLYYFRLFLSESKEGFIFLSANKSRHSSKVNNGDLATEGLLMFHQSDLLHTAHQILILKEYSPKSHLF